MNSIKILYMDSDSVHTRACLHHIINQGHEVKFVSSTQDALIECTFRKPELIIFEHTLENNDCFAFIKQM